MTWLEEDVNIDLAIWAWSVNIDKLHLRSMREWGEPFPITVLLDLCKMMRGCQNFCMTWLPHDRSNATHPVGAAWDM